MTRRLALLGIVLLLLSLPLNAQYFGRNKVQWENFHFKVLQTPHFDIYYYDQEADVVNDVGRMAERWYDRLSRTFNHTFNRKPIVGFARSSRACASFAFRSSSRRRSRLVIREPYALAL